MVYDTPDGTLPPSGNPDNGDFFNAPATARVVEGSISGLFAGQDADGPLSTLGTWTLEGGVNDSRFEDGVLVEGSDRTNYLGVGNARNTIHGAFGADIAP